MALQTLSLQLKIELNSNKMDLNKINQAEEIKQKIREAFDIEESIELRIGLLFTEAEDLKVWDGQETLKDFLGSLGKKRAKRSTVNRRILNYKAFCRIADYNIDEIDNIDSSRLSWIRETFFARDLDGNLKLIIPKEKLDEWVERAKPVLDGGLSVTDFNILKKQYSKNIPEDHPHKWNKKEQFECETCGEKSWVNPNEKN